MSPGTAPIVSAIWGASSTDVWAAISSGGFVHWDGAEWSLVGPANTGGVTMSGSGPADIWAMGITADFFAGANPSGATWMSHYDGTSWSLTNPTTLPTNPDALGASSICATGPDDAWLFALSALFHWNGTAWADVEISLTASGIAAMWASAPNDVWAVGSSPSGPAFSHWDGTAWSSAVSWSGGGEMMFEPGSVMWGSGTADVWLAGNGEMAHWNGAEWSGASGSPAGVWSIWGTSAHDVWALSDTGVINHWNGSTWTLMTLPAPPAPAAAFALDSIWGSGRDDVWAVGSGAPFHNPYSVAVTPGAVHWDGAVWSAESTPVPFVSIAGKATNDVWASASTGDFYHWDGTAWTVGSSLAYPVWNPLLFASPAGDIWAWAGTDILHHD